METLLILILTIPRQPTSTTSLPYSKHIFLANTSIAAVSCPNNDRWVFSQDLSGSIRAAQFTNSTWSFASTSYNFTPAKLGTALGASCFEFPTITNGFSILSAGTYVSWPKPFDTLPLTEYVQLNLVYFNASNNLQQSLYNGGSWKDSPVYPALEPPDNNTKVSVTGLSHMNVIFPTANGSNISSSTFSSFAVYQSNRSLVAIDLDPLSNLPQDPHVNPNHASHYENQGLLTFVGESFACIFRGTYSSRYYDWFTRCAIGNAGIPSDSFITNLLWQSTNSTNSTGYSANVTNSDLDASETGFYLLPEGTGMQN